MNWLVKNVENIFYDICTCTHTCCWHASNITATITDWGVWLSINIRVDYWLLRVTGEELSQ